MKLLIFLGTYVVLALILNPIWAKISVKASVLDPTTTPLYVDFVFMALGLVVIIISSYHAFVKIFG